MLKHIQHISNGFTKCLTFYQMIGNTYWILVMLSNACQCFLILANRQHPTCYYVYLSFSKSIFIYLISFIGPSSSVFGTYLGYYSKFLRNFMCAYHYQWLKRECWLRSFCWIANCCQYIRPTNGKDDNISVWISSPNLMLTEINLVMIELNSLTWLVN